MLFNLCANNHNEILSAIAMLYLEDTLFIVHYSIFWVFHSFYVIFCNAPWVLEGIIQLSTLEFNTELLGKTLKMSISVGQIRPDKPK